jgi:exosortase/archaeosortase family protein
MTQEPGQPDTSTAPAPPSPGSDPPRDPARAATGFVVKLVILTLLVGFGESYLHQIGWGESFQVFVAKMGAALARIFDSDIVRQGREIDTDGPPLIVTLECTALFATGLFCAAVVAYPCSWRARLFGILIGIFGVGVVNVVRITGLVIIAHWIPEMFHFAHLVLMQGFLISCVAPLWLAWAVLFTRGSRRAASSTGEQ